MTAKISAKGHAPQKYCSQHNFPSRQRDAAAHAQKGATDHEDNPRDTADGPLRAAAAAAPQQQKHGRPAVQGGGNANHRAAAQPAASTPASAGGEPAAAASPSAPRQSARAATQLAAPTPPLAVAFAAKEERVDEVDSGRDEIDDGSGDDRDADDSGDDRDADDGDCANDVDDDSSVDDYDSSDDGDGEIADDADDYDDMDPGDYYSEIVNDSDDAEFDMDARDAYSKEIRANDEACRVSVDDGADPDEAYAKEHSANFKAYKVYLKANKDYVDKQRCEEFDAIVAEYKANELKQIQDTLESDARIASNVPSAADRRYLEEVNTRNRAIFDKAMYGRTESERLEFLAASHPFYRDRKAHNAQATQMLQAREANGEDVRTVRASWEAYNRYGCFGALDDAFFDPSNG
jgi:hypothetical protein